MRLKGIEIFASGTRPDSSGRIATWTDADLDEMSAAYNEVASAGTHEAPVQDSHADTGLAFGWLEKVYRQGSKLLADYKDVAPDFAAAANEGRWKKRSVSIYPRSHSANPTPGRLNVRHLGYVGVPAVKGLKDHEFREPEEGVCCFEFEASASESTVDHMDWQAADGFANVSTIFQSLRDRMIVSDSIEEADKVFPKEVITSLSKSGGDFYITDDAFSERMRPYESQIEELQSRLAMAIAKIQSLKSSDYQEVSNTQLDTAMADDTTQPKKEQGVSSAEFQELSQKLEQMEAQFSEAKATQATQATQIEALTTQNDLLRQHSAQLEAKDERNAVASFVEAQINDRKILPADRQRQIELILSMPSKDKVEFSEGEGKAEKTPRQAYMDSVVESPPRWSGEPMADVTGPLHSYGETRSAAQEGFDAESSRHFQVVEAYRKERNCSFSEAMDALQIVT